jgi:DNA-nicking Smr family endonuclease
MTEETPSRIDLPIDGVLDLHTFRPKDVRDVLLDYIALCQERGILELRVIHGKGIGQLRNTVHAILARHASVHSFALATEPFGGSGATIVRLVGAASPKT